MQFPTCKILLFSGQAVTVDLLENPRTQGHQLDLLLQPIPLTKLLFGGGENDQRCPRNLRKPKSLSQRPTV
jgi:hypothetical protein